MGRSDNPVSVNKWSSTDVAIINSERNLPRPGVGLGIFAIHDPACKWSFPAAWNKGRIDEIFPLESQSTSHVLNRIIDLKIHKLNLTNVNR